MSDIDSVLERLRRAYAAIGEVEAVAARSPGDRFVLANLQALKRDAADLEQQWKDECRRAQIEICRYRIIPDNAHRYSLASVSRSLLDFQELFSQIYDALKTGVRKRRARVGAEIAAETKFDFGFTYPGSLGVALIIESETGLFTGKFDETMKAIGDIISIDDQGAVRNLANALGGAVVTKVYDWSRVNYGAGYGVDITWEKVDGTVRGGLIDTTSLGKIADLILRTSDRSRKEIEVRGVLVAIDVIRKTFRLVQPDGADYRGNLGENFLITRKWAVNTNYAAQIVIEEITKYATMETERTYKLDGLKVVKSS